VPIPGDSPLEQAVAQLQGHRAALGDAAVDAAIAALRRHAPREHGAANAEQRLRQVSVLFADVADSTAMLGRVSTEDAMDLLGSALQMFADAVHRWGGEVLRYTGDGIKAVFGMQGLREDEAERAVRAGLQILQEAAGHAQRMQDELGVRQFGVRVGIHTGSVLLGGGPEAERAAMGHAVHLAARMEQSAPVGRLRVSDTTWAQVRGLFKAQAQAPLTVKGHDEPLRTWLVQAVEAGAEPSVVRGVEGMDTPTIGREHELERLAALYSHCVAARCIGVATVLAEAGVGKTRLRHELLHRLGLSDGAPGLMQARAHPSSGLQPYGLLRQLLARWLAIGDDQAAAAARQRLVEGLTPWLGAQAAQQAPRIGQLIGLDFGQHPAVAALDAAALREQAFGALRAALYARAAHAPLLVVLDDLHWADDASLGFVQSLLQAAERPLLLLLLARPSLRERGVALDPPAGVHAESLHLRPLGPAHARELVLALLRPLTATPESLQEMLLQRAEGNPFFLEALVRMLIDDGVIDATAMPWRLHQDRLDALRVPPTLVGVLQARLDALAAGDRQALQQASIVGPVFWDAALASIEANAPAALPRLARRGLVVPRDRSVFADTAEHAFAHALLHDVTYGTVLKGPRRAGHAAVARWLSERVTDRANEFLAITAEHFERAGDSAQALEFWDRAQHDAFKRHANEAALQFIERALAQPALRDARWRYTLLANRHAVLERLGRAGDAAQAGVQMAAWADACDDHAMRADVMSSRMLVADHAGRTDAAQRLALQALALAQQADAAVTTTPPRRRGWRPASRRRASLPASTGARWVTADTSSSCAPSRSRHCCSKDATLMCWLPWMRGWPGSTSACRTASIC
jgi:class 3 adenylate cyclase